MLCCIIREPSWASWYDMMRDDTHKLGDKKKHEKNIAHNVRLSRASSYAQGYLVVSFSHSCCGVP